MASTAVLLNCALLLLLLLLLHSKFAQANTCAAMKPCESFDINEVNATLDRNSIISNRSLSIVERARMDTPRFQGNCQAFKQFACAATAHKPGSSDDDECVTYSDQRTTGEFLTFKRDKLDALLATPHAARWPETIQSQLGALKYTVMGTTMAEDIKRIHTNVTSRFEVGHAILNAFYDRDDSTWHALILTSALKGKTVDPACSYDTSFRALMNSDYATAALDYQIALAAMSPDVVRSYMDFARDGADSVLKKIEAIPNLDLPANWSLGGLSQALSRLTPAQKEILLGYGLKVLMYGGGYALSIIFGF